jgi:hypothetical protein
MKGLAPATRAIARQFQIAVRKFPPLGENLFSAEAHPPDMLRVVLSIKVGAYATRRMSSMV